MVDSGPGKPDRSACAKVKIVAKVGPGEFFKQVRAESAKIVWPSQKQTVQSAIMVVIMTSLLAIFFFVTDQAFHAIVKALLGLLS